MFVAIITPFYNTGAIFHETAASVFAQTCQNWEWIIVNDGSTDAEALATLNLLRHIGDSRVVVIDQQNYGLPGARNAGVAASSAPLLFFLDSDDLLAPIALEQLSQLLQHDSHASFATTWVQAFGAKSFVWQRGFDSGNLFLFENTVTALSMIRRSVFDAVGGFDEQRVGGLEDYEFWIRAAAKGYWGTDIHEPLTFQRYKHADEYIHYRWANRDEPAKLRAFQDDIRRSYPKLYREGVPHLRATGKSAHVYARERISLWAFPLARWLRMQKQQFTTSAIWRISSPFWQRLKGAVRYNTVVL